MAKISFEMDTVEKTYSLTLDGEAIENVSSLSAYMFLPYGESDGDGDDDDKCSLSIETIERDEEEGIRRHTCIRASEKGIEKTTEEKTVAKPIFKHVADFMANMSKR